MSEKRVRRWLVVGIMMLVIIAVISVSGYQSIMLKSREQILETNLASLRNVITQYSRDKQRPPQSLQDLTDSGYFRELPVDPFTDSRSSWMPVIGDVATNGKIYRGITDVKSGAILTSSRGSSYNNW